MNTSLKDSPARNSSRYPVLMSADITDIGPVVVLMTKVTSTGNFGTGTVVYAEKGQHLGVHRDDWKMDRFEDLAPNKAVALQN